MSEQPMIRLRKAKCVVGKPFTFCETSVEAACVLVASLAKPSVLTSKINTFQWRSGHEQGSHTQE